MSIPSWIRGLFTRPATRPIRKALRRTCLRLEALEDRAVPAVFTVLNGADGGAGSLRDALTAAAGTPGPSTISFDSGVTTVTLTSGQLDITSNVSIIDPTDTVTITRDTTGPQTAKFSIIRVEKGATLALTGLTISNGNAGSYGVGSETGQGGGMENLGTATLTDCTFSNNSAGAVGDKIGGYGGAVYGVTYSTTTLSHCTITDNTALVGGGVGNQGTLTLNNHCTISDNNAGWGGGLQNNGTATLTDSTFNNNGSNQFTLDGVNNQSTLEGGALFLNKGVTTKLTNCNISTNTSYRGAGLYADNAPSVQLVNCTVSGNTATTGSGAGVYNRYSNVTIQNCTVSTNTAARFGGGVFNLGTTTVTDSTLSSNSANISGGGVGTNGGPSQIALTDCTLTGNLAPDGGGLWVSGTSSTALATATLLNCTVSGNSAKNPAIGGNSATPPTIGYCGGGIGQDSSGIVTLGNTIVAKNTSDGTGPDLFETPAAGSVTSLGHNLIGVTDGSNWLGSDQVGITAPLDPMLDVLADNGGPTGFHTQTMPLLLGSPAIGHGDSALLAEVQTVTVTGSKGTFTLTFNGQTTGAIALSASASTVQTALNNLSSIGGVVGSVTVTRSGNVFTITFGAALATTNVSQITACGYGGTTAAVATVRDGNDGDQRTYARTGPAEVQTLTVTFTPPKKSSPSPTFTLTFSGQNTGSIPYNATADTVQAALNNLPCIKNSGGSVTVTPSGNVFTITFGGALTGKNVPQITATPSGNGLTTSVATVQDGSTVTDIGAYESDGIAVG
jgi:hypothetical protein